MGVFLRQILSLRARMKYDDFCTEYCPMTRDLAGQWVVGVSDTCPDKVKCEGWRRYEIQYSTVQYSTVQYSTEEIRT